MYSVLQSSLHGPQGAADACMVHALMHQTVKQMSVQAIWSKAQDQVLMSAYMMPTVQQMLAGGRLAQKHIPNTSTSAFMHMCRTEADANTQQTPGILNSIASGECSVAPPFQPGHSSGVHQLPSCT